MKAVRRDVWKEPYLGVFIRQSCVHKQLEDPFISVMHMRLIYSDVFRISNLGTDIERAIDNATN